MGSIYKQFIQSLRWNTVESIIYHGIFILHQYALFITLGRNEYGLIGTLFSGIYCIVTLMNLGFDESCAPFFSYWTQSKQAYKEYVYTHLIPNYIVGISLIGISIISCTLYNFTSHISWQLWCTMTAIVLLESTKKTIKTMLLLLFKAHYVAPIEISTICVYTSIVWTTYFLGFTITLYTIFIPMFLVSAGSTLCAVYALYHWYTTLMPSNTCSVYSTRRMLKTRFYMYVYTISKELCSSNVLVPLFAVRLGFSHAGLFKIISTTIQSIALILHKIFLPSQAALLMHTNNQSTRKTYFANTANYLYHIIIGLLIFGIVNYSTFIDTHSPDVLIFIALCLILNFADTILIPYTTWYIIHDHAGIFTFLHSIVLGIIAYCITQSYTAYTIIIIAYTVRFIAFMILGTIAYYIWHIKPRLQINPHYIASALAVSITVLLFFR